MGRLPLNTVAFAALAASVVVGVSSPASTNARSKPRAAVSRDSSLTADVLAARMATSKYAALLLYEHAPRPLAPTPAQIAVWNHPPAIAFYGGGAPKLPATGAAMATIHVDRVAGAQSGFDWADAGIGAAGGLALSGVVAVSAAARRRRTHRLVTS